MSDVLITTYTFKHRPYLIRMNHSECLDLVLTDKQTGEEWECSHGVAYIENLTRKTGNFKQFKIFIAMLKSGLLKTSECISLDLYTYKDFEDMRLRKIKSTIKMKNNIDSNRRFLVLTYCVEFDKISYPLPLDYCGPPDPSILQATVRKLEIELNKARTELSKKDNSDNKKYIKTLTKRIDQLTEENINLNDEIRRLTKLVNKNPKNQVEVLQKAINQLEKSIKCERSSHHKLVEKLQNDKEQLHKQLEYVKSTEKMLKYKLQNLSENRSNIGNKNKCDAYIRSQVQKNGLSTKTNKEANMLYRSRSASPRISRTDNSNNIKKRTKIKTQSRSRSNSLTSKKESLSDLLQHRSISRHESRASSPMYKSNSTSSLACSSYINTLTRTNNTRNSRRAQTVQTLEKHLNKLIKNYM